VARHSIIVEWLQVTRMERFLSFKISGIQRPEIEIPSGYDIDDRQGIATAKPRKQTGAKDLRLTRQSVRLTIIHLAQPSRITIIQELWVTSGS